MVISGKLANPTIVHGIHTASPRAGEGISLGQRRNRGSARRRYCYVSDPGDGRYAWQDYDEETTPILG